MVKVLKIWPILWHFFLILFKYIFFHFLNPHVTWSPSEMEELYMCSLGGGIPGWEQPLGLLSLSEMKAWFQMSVVLQYSQELFLLHRILYLLHYFWSMQSIYAQLPSLTMKTVGGSCFPRWELWIRKGILVMLVMLVYHSKLTFCLYSTLPKASEP